MKLRRISILTAVVLLTLLVAPGSVFAQDEEKPALYPDTAREAPELDLTSQDESDQLNRGLTAVNAGDLSKARSILEPFATGIATDSLYAQALALQGLANLSYKQDKMDDAVSQLKRAIDIGVLPNDIYFQLMYQLAQFYLVNEQYAEAVATLHKWRTEGKADSAESWGLEGQAYYRLKKYPEAIAAIKKAKAMSGQSKAVWDQLLAASYAETGQTGQAVAIAHERMAKNPGDIVTQRNAINLLMNAHEYAEAIKVINEAQAKGLMLEPNDYINLAKMHVLIAQGSDTPKTHADKAIAVLDDGLAKGALEPGFDVYMLKGNAAYISADDSTALAAYAKAAEYGTTGAADLRRARMLSNLGRDSEARTAVNGAIAKGVADMGAAYMLLARTERAMKNKNAAIAAVKKAATYPETKAQAEQWLREIGM